MKKILSIVIVLNLIFISSVLVQAATLGTNKSTSSNKGKGSIKILLTVDWEGISLNSDDLTAMKQFRNLYPNIPLVQFLNPVYYTRGESVASDINSKLKDVITNNDEIGLHLHGWQSLIKAANVNFIAQPYFDRGNQQTYNNDLGFDVPITEYTKAQLKSIIQTSKSILSKNGYSNIKSFRAGGWVSNDDLKASLMDQGFKYDYSPVPCELLKNKLSPTYLYAILQNAWEGITSNSQPYIVSNAQKSLIEIPNNCTLVDYVDGNTMVNLYKSAVTDYNKNPNLDRVLVYGFHQESCYEYILEFENALDRIIDLAETQNTPIEFVKSSDINLDNLAGNVVKNNGVVIENSPAQQSGYQQYVPYEESIDNNSYYPSNNPGSYPTIAPNGNPANIITSYPESPSIGQDLSSQIQQSIAGKIISGVKTSVNDTISNTVNRIIGSISIF